MQAGCRKLWLPRQRLLPQPSHAVQVVLRAHPKTPFRRLFQVFSDTMGVSLGHIKFMGNINYGWKRLDADDQLGIFGRPCVSVTVQNVPEAMDDVAMGYINI